MGDLSAMFPEKGDALATSLGYQPHRRGLTSTQATRLAHSAVNEFARMSDEELRQVIVDHAQALEALGIDLSPAPRPTPRSTELSRGHSVLLQSKLGEVVGGPP